LRGIVLNVAEGLTEDMAAEYTMLTEHTGQMS